MLNDFRQEAAHLNDIINELLAKYDIDSESLKSGWGLLLDKFYDGLGGSLDEINHLLSQICRNIYCSVDE
jgi:hypothetical protein